MIHQYRKKPVVIEAFQMTSARRANPSDWPEWLKEAWLKPSSQEGALFPTVFPEGAIGTDELYINSPEGKMFVRFNDYIIRGVKGEIYPCNPDIFEATYEKVNP